MIRAVIIDDEFLARQRVLKLLEDYMEIKCIGEAKNGLLGLELIKEAEPDLVFLDVQMSDIDGFELLARLKLKVKPYIVFTTAYDSYAIKAFNVHALDYLLKPFDGDRFAESMNKVIEYFNIKKSSDFGDKLMGLIKDFDRQDDNYITKFEIKDRGYETIIDIDDILYIEANGNYLNLTTKDKVHLYRATMNTINADLNPDYFLRVHRSFILKKSNISKCVYLNNNEYEFYIKNGDKVRSGRSYKEDIIAYLKS
ncbi:LytR/AlgR family response regulator transcription factor [Fulvivirga lutimaris]|uniref:LytR/AlgR family response regulator transcription factor n=1 Tax=Fulvivirga lutimaris TaxID=1819566 RepID=UPI0012BB71D0|nr:response regulator transcription factor [Fulvivirga lutimaris]MTI39854.1 response regulator transcription factor [Fulvivirga lutimaris]